jgi:hypothetical protein
MTREEYHNLLKTRRAELNRSIEHRQKVSKAKLGKKFTDAHKQAITQGMIRHWKQRKAKQCTNVT